MAEDIGSVFAGFWRRFAALMIDLILMLPVYLLLRKVGLGSYQADAVNLVLICVAYCLFMASRWQATPGMRVMRVLAVDVEHTRLRRNKAMVWCVTSVVAVMIVFAPVLTVLPTPETDAINRKVIEAKLAGEDPLSVFDGYNAAQVTAYAEHNERLRMRAPLTVLLALLWVGTIVAGKQKAGVHNWLVGVRFIKGRTA